MLYIKICNVILLIFFLHTCLVVNKIYTQILNESFKVLEVKLYLLPVIFTGISNYSLKDVAIIAKDVRFIGLMKHGLEGECGSWTHPLLSYARMRQVLTTGAAFWDNWQLLLYFFILLKRRRKEIYLKKLWNILWDSSEFLFFFSNKEKQL